MTDTYHQQLMNEAYDQYTNADTYKTFIFKLDHRHKIAVLTGNLNYQVENGGFVQWCENGYVEEAESLVMALDAIATDAALKVKDLVIKAANDYIRCESFSDYESFVPPSKFTETFWEETDKLDEQYGVISEQFLIDCERYLLGLKP